ncbi:MAG TPA: hypothetical protein VHK24_12180 [Steroidobacter sp.]|nr:hypothetical protein [Steroidobacter sp.]
MHHASRLAVLLLAALNVPWAARGEPFSALDLHAHCAAYAENPHSSMGRCCKAYVLGFLAGVSVLEASAANARASQRESFTARALRTRLGVQKADERSACLTCLASVEELIGQVLAQALDQPPAPGMSAREMLVTTFERFHCGAADGR